MNATELICLTHQKLKVGLLQKFRAEKRNEDPLVYWRASRGWTEMKALQDRDGTQKTLRTRGEGRLTEEGNRWDGGGA